MRRTDPPDGWEVYIAPNDPDRLRRSVSGEIATVESEARPVTDERVATPMSYMPAADRDDRADIDVPQPRPRAGR